MGGPLICRNVSEFRASNKEMTFAEVLVSACNTLVSESFFSRCVKKGSSKPIMLLVRKPIYPHRAPSIQNWSSNGRYISLINTHP